MGILDLKNSELPRISFVLCTYFGERTLGKCLKTFFDQDYPLDKLEIIIADGGSKDKTLQIIDSYKKKYPNVVKYVHNPRQFSDGKGNGIDMASRKTRFEIIGFIDQDNIFVQKDWIKKMIAPLLADKRIVAVQSRLAIPSQGTAIDKYLGAVGVEDPFAIPYSLTAQISLNPHIFSYETVGDYFTYTLTKENFLYGGNNGCLVRRKEFFDIGGYVQDTDEFYNFALRGHTVAVPNNARLHHWSSIGLKHFIIKRGKYVVHYLTKNYEGRSFYWFSLAHNTLAQNLRYLRTVVYNLAFFPGFFKGTSQMLRTRKAYWLLHPVVLSSITASYIYAFLYAKITSHNNRQVHLDMTKQTGG